MVVVNKNNNKNNVTVKSYTAKDILKNIKTNIQEMKNNWDIIRKHNVLDKTMQPHYNLEEIYKQNIKLEKEIIDLKLMSLAINLGLNNIKDIPKNSSFATIYVLSQLKSRIDNLKTIRVNFNPTTETISFKKGFIMNEIRILEKEVLKCEVELEQFNINSKVSA